MRRFIGLLIVMFVISILGGIFFPPKDKTKVNVKINVEKKEVEVPKNDIWKDIERYTNKEATDL